MGTGSSVVLLLYAIEPVGCRMCVTLLHIVRVASLLQPLSAVGTKRRAKSGDLIAWLAA